MSRWIKIYEDVREHWIYQNPVWYQWWTDMLFEASFKDSKILVRKQVVELKRGQLSGSISYFVKRWNTTKDQVIGFFKVLQNEGMINKISDKNVTIITICNYDSYQGKADNKSDSLSDNIPDNIPDNKSDTNKECIEGKEIYNNTTTTHAREQEYINRYRTEGMWSDVALILHKKIAECEHLFDRWIVEYQHNGDRHNDYSDFKKHFIQWARITIQKESKQNGNNDRQNQRRGVQVVANKVEDYQGSF